MVVGSVTVVVKIALIHLLWVRSVVGWTEPRLPCRQESFSKNSRAQRHIPKATLYSELEARGPDESPVTISDTAESSHPRRKLSPSRRAFVSSCLLAIPLSAQAATQVAHTPPQPPSHKKAQSFRDADSIHLASTPTAGVATTARQESFSGFVAGATLTLTKTLVKYPLDTATVRLQMPDTVYSIRHVGALLDGAYIGIASPLAANLPAGAVFFGVKDAVQSALSSSQTFSGGTTVPQSARWLNTCLAVAVAQIPYWIVRNPSEIVKTRQQAGSPGYGDGVGALEAYRAVRDERRQQQAAISSSKAESITKPDSPLAGLDAFYTGYWENILYAYPADVIKFVAYDAFTHGRKNLPPAQGAVAGAAATAVAQLVTTPLDVVRNRIMASGTAGSSQDKVAINGDGSTETTSTSTSTTSYLDSLVQLGREEGVSGLFAGAAPRFGKALLSGAIQFATYEETKQAIGKRFLRNSAK